MRRGAAVARYASNFRCRSRCSSFVAALYSIAHSREGLVRHLEAWFSFFGSMEAALCSDWFPADGFHVGLGCIVGRRARSGNLRSFLAPRSSSRPCSGPNSIRGHQPPSWDGGLCFLSKASGAARAAMALRALDGFFGNLPRRYVLRSVALGGTCSDNPGGNNNFYDLSIRGARGEMPPD